MKASFKPGETLFAAAFHVTKESWLFQSARDMAEVLFVTRRRNDLERFVKSLNYPFDVRKVQKIVIHHAPALPKRTRKKGTP